MSDSLSINVYPVDVHWGEGDDILRWNGTKNAVRYPRGSFVEKRYFVEDASIPQVCKHLNENGGVQIDPDNQTHLMREMAHRYNRENSPVGAKQIRIASEAPVATEKATRSADVDKLDFVSIPMIGLIAVARTAGEGAEKYGRYNFAKGLSAAGCLNHALAHISQYILGDRSEPHLPHAAWNLLAAIQSIELDPHEAEREFMGRGFTITDKIREELKAHAERVKDRTVEEREKLGQWLTSSIPQIVNVLNQRHDELLRLASNKMRE